MIECKPLDYQFCPMCGTPLSCRHHDNRDRKFCSKDGWTYYPSNSIGAAAIILRDNKILLVQRNREPYKGRWMLPAGFVEFGEHPKNTVVREVEEETGHKAKNPELFDVLQIYDDPRDAGHLVFYYKVEVDGDAGDILDIEENQDMREFDLDNLPPLAFQATAGILSRLKNSI